jgi:alkylation response protein AidB-like acyl-CoA dehydrogenase
VWREITAWRGRAYEVAVDYALNPRQFGKPDRCFQLVHDKLSRMLSDILGYSCLAYVWSTCRTPVTSAPCR